MLNQWIMSISTPDVDVIPWLDCIGPISSFIINMVFRYFSCDVWKRCRDNIKSIVWRTLLAHLHARVYVGADGIHFFSSSPTMTCAALFISPPGWSRRLPPCHPLILITLSLCWSRCVSKSESQCSHHPTLCGETRACDIWECWKAWEE